MEAVVVAVVVLLAALTWLLYKLAASVETRR
jgi:hypothetical protein